MADSKREMYGVIAAGNCLGDLVPEGTVLVVKPGEEIAPWDLVMIVFDPSKPGPWARYHRALADEGHNGMAKIFLATYQVDRETIGLFGHLNPPGIVPIPMSALLTVDKVIFQGECAGEDREALEMLRPFAMAPIEQKEAA